VKAALYCRSNKPAVMELLLKKSTTGMNVVNKNKRTSLHVAVCKQHVDCVRVLLNYHCDVNLQVRRILFSRRSQPFPFVLCAILRHYVRRMCAFVENFQFTAL